MTDTVPPAVRSQMMRGIGAKHTAPEMRVRSFLHASGLRYRLHSSRLPGKPDIVLPKFRCVVFVHGCFWHRHPGCRFATTPATRPDFWRHKFEQNVERDARVQTSIEALGWRVLIIWECETKSVEALEKLRFQIVHGSAFLKRHDKVTHR